MQEEDEDDLGPGLTQRQEAFCRYLSENKNATEAYRLAGYNSRDPHAKASRMAASGKVKARLSEMRASLAKESKFTKLRALEILEEIAESVEERSSDRINAIKTAGQFCGWETGTEADNKQAAAIESLGAAVSRIRSMGRK